MTPFLENLIRGAASVTLMPTSDYNLQRIMARYEREAQRRARPLDLALINTVSREHMMGAVLFALACFAFMAAAVLLVSWSEPVAFILAAAPTALFLGVQWVESRLSA